MSRNFHPCKLVPQIHVSHFQSPRRVQHGRLQHCSYLGRTCRYTGAFRRWHRRTAVRHIAEEHSRAGGSASRCRTWRCTCPTPTNHWTELGLSRHRYWLVTADHVCSVDHVLDYDQSLKLPSTRNVYAIMTQLYSVAVFVCCMAYCRNLCPASVSCICITNKVFV